MGGFFATRLPGAVAAVAVSAAWAAAPATAETMDALYAKAKAEGNFVVYTGGPAAPWEAMAKQFEARFPGIAVSVTGGFSNVLDVKIDRQLKDKKVETDMAVFQTLADFVRWDKEGVLLPFKPEGFDKIDESFKEPHGRYIGVQVIAMPYEYNTKLVAPADVPKSALDFLKPEFRGKVVAAYPADDDATLYVFYNIVRKYGWTYMERYKANQPNYIQGHLGEQRSISAGQNLVTLDSIFNITLPEKQAGQPVDAAFSAIDPVPIWPLTEAIFKDAPHPDAAKLFLTWMLTKEEQAKTGTWSVRSDVPPPPGTKPIFAYKVVNTYRQFLTDQAKIAALRKRFEDYTGPVVNKGGVR